MPVLHEISFEKIQENLAAFSKLSKGEFNCDLIDLLRDNDEQLTMKRIGRLMSVSIKQPFAKPFPYDPNLPWNWAKSNRAWEILGPIPSQLRNAYYSQYQFLAQVAQEWRIPEYKIAEWHVFHVICNHFRPIICGESELLEETNKIAEEIRKSGWPVSTLSMNDIIGPFSVTVATWLSTRLDFPSDLLPIVTGTTVLLCCYGKNKLCKFLTDFKAAHEANPNPFSEYPKCESTETYDRKPCENEVLNVGDQCWKHTKKRN